MDKLSPKLQGALLGLTAFSFLSFGDTTIKTLTAYYDIFAVGLYTNIFTIAFLLPILFYKDGWKKAFTTHSFPLHVLRSIFMLCIFLSIIYALKVLPIANTYTITYSMPFILNILALLILKEKISSYRWFAIFTAFIGIVIALRPDTMVFNLGTLAAMVVALFLAANTITVKFIDPRDHWMTFIAYPMAIQTPVIALIVSLRDQPLLPEWSVIPSLWMIAGGFFYAVGLILLPQAIKRTETSIFGYTQYITFLWAVILGYFIFSDMLDVWTATGAMIIVASGIFLIYREKVENSKILEIEEDGHIGQR